MKKIILTFVALMSVVASFGQEVNETVAMQRALEFINKSDGKPKKFLSGKQATSADLKHAYTSTGEKGNNFFVYNVGKNEGFVIVSADEKAEVILGYTDKGTFDMNNMAPAMKWWMDEYEKEIQAVKDNIPLIHNQSEQIARVNIEPLVTTKWGQGEPYNKMTPMYDDTHHCPTGCVATAMAQVLNYHKYPEHGFGSHSYNWIVPMQGEQVLSVDFSQSTYQWDYMADGFVPESMSGYHITEAEKAVALLMRDCGFSVNMMYDMFESGAFSNNIPNVLKEHFGFNEHTTLIDRYMFSTEDWESILYNEIEHNRPVIYGGSVIDNYTPGSGHAFICDGYFDGYFHFNFGWEGNYDGFFKTDAIQASYLSSTIGYNCGQQATLCYPRDVDSPFSINDYTLREQPYKLEVIELTKPTAVYSGHCIEVKAKIRNNGTQEYHGSIALNNHPDIIGTSTIVGIEGLSLKAGETKEVVLGAGSEGIETLIINPAINGNTFAIVDLLCMNDITEPFSVEIKNCPTPITISGISYLWVNDAESAMVTFPNTDKYEGDIVIPDNVSYEGTDIPVKYISDGAFYRDYCMNLKSVSIPASVGKIGQMALWNECPKYIVNWDTPIAIEQDIQFSSEYQQELDVPAGSGQLYANAKGWRTFRHICENGQSVSEKIKLQLNVYGGGSVSIGEYGSCTDHTEYYRDFVPANRDIQMSFSPNYGNEVLLLQDVSDTYNNNIYDITNDAESYTYTFRTTPNTDKSFAVFFGFKDNGLAYSIVSDKEAVVLCPTLYTGIGGYSGDIDIPASITRNGKTYIVGGIQKLALQSLTSITLHWQDPIEVSEDVFAQTTFTDVTLNVPEGSAEKYLKHPIWGKFSKIVENGVVIKDAVTISFDQTMRRYGYCLINGVDYTHRVYTANKGDDVTITFKPYPLSSIVYCKINGVDIKNQLGNDDTYTIQNIQTPQNISCNYALNVAGVWYTADCNIEYVYNLDYSGQYLSTDSTYRYVGERWVVPGIYSGDVNIPESISIPETVVSDHVHVFESTCNVTQLDWYFLSSSICDNLHSVSIPKSINYFGIGALHDFHYQYLIVPWNEPYDVPIEVFSQGRYEWSGKTMFDNATLMVPVGTLDKYKNHATWGLFKNIVEGNDWRTYEQTFPLGDTNFDEKVSVTDYVSVASQIVDVEKPHKFNITQADVNGDGNIDAADYVLVANIILYDHPNGNGAMYASCHAATNWDDAQVTLCIDNSSVMTLSSRNTGVFSAFQFDMELPEGLSISESVKAFSSFDHKLTWAYQGNNKYRFLCGAMNNSNICDDKLLSISLEAVNGFEDGDIILSNICLVESNGCKHSVEDLKNNFSGITTGIEVMSVVGNRPIDYAVYDLQGRKVRSGLKDVKHLPAGMYLINGKSYLIK